MKQKHVIEIPKGTRFLSEVQGFELPNGILDKEVTGCGATTLALTDDKPSIIASPRIALVRNKARKFLPPKSFAVATGIYGQDVRKYLDDCAELGIVPKVITTYDSLGKISACLSKEELGSFRLVVDEFHNILNDSTFKAAAELEVLEECSKYSHVTYLPATPMLDKYLENIDYFKNVEYHCLKWDKDDILEFRLYDNPTSNPLGAICEVIKDYKTHGFIDIDGVRSYEAVIFLNSVKNILNVINTCQLTPEECNIIISNRKDNKAVLDAFGIDKSYPFTIGDIPLKGEPNKMFTFCTSTAYQGCDFYSDSAMTYIVSDSTIPNTVVDIFTELPQIIGRQRDDNNPFRNKAAFYYRTGAFYAEESLMRQELEELDKRTRNIISSINAIPDTSTRAIIAEGYYCGLSVREGLESFVYFDKEKGEMVFNPMARNGFVWRCDVKSMYRDKDRINQLLVKLHRVSVQESSEDHEVSPALTKYTSTVFRDAMQKYCDLKAQQCTSSGMSLVKVNLQLLEEKEGSNIWSRCEYYYNLLGPEKIQALSYQESKIKPEALKASRHRLIQAQIDAHYTDGQRIEKARLKGQMQSIYDSLGLKVKAKATDIEDYGFRCEECKFTINGKRVHGFILKKTS